jgi:HEAT repeat protein
MNRKKKTVLAVGVLVGVAAIAVLLLQILGGADTQARRIRREITDTRERYVERGAPGRVTARNPGNGRIQPPGAAASGGGTRRQPWDGPEWRAYIARTKSEILDLLEQIPNEPDSGKRRDLYNQLRERVRKLGHRVDPQVREALLGMIETVDPAWRALVGETLGYLRGDEETAKKLTEMLQGRASDVSTRRAILLALRNMKVESVVPSLLGMLRTDAKDKSYIATAIGEIGGRAAYDGLLEELDRALDSRTRASIEQALSRARDPVTLEKVKQALVQAEPDSRLSYIKILAQTRDPRYGDVMRRVLQEETNFRARKAAIRALGRMGDQAAGKALLGLVATGSERDRAEATRALHFIRDPETIETLARDWDRLDEPARAAVMGAAGRLASPGEKLLELAAQGIRDPGGRVRRTAAKLLGRRGYDKGVEPIVGFIRAEAGAADVSAGLHALLEIRTRKAARAGLDALDRIANERQRRWWEDQFERVLEQAPGQE